MPELEEKEETSGYDALCQRLPERIVGKIHQAIGRASMCMRLTWK